MSVNTDTMHWLLIGCLHHSASHCLCCRVNRQ